MFRTRFKREIVAEFLPPVRFAKKQKVIILCDGMPSVPRKQPLMEFLSGKGYWVFYPRYRGAWESGGQFLEKSPARDISDVIDEIQTGVKEIAFGKKYNLSPDEIFVIGGSFGGTTAILSSLDARVKKVVANCPIVDWSILSAEQKKETSNASYPDYIRQAFGEGYRLSGRNWNKLRKGRFFNPVNHSKELDGTKLLIFHAKDDPFVPWRGVRQFAQQTGAAMVLLQRGGHSRTEHIVQTHWTRIARFFNTKR
jgi:dipeptidyl aminopeptidase/acylaminoacyl peptidase